MKLDRFLSLFAATIGLVGGLFLACGIFLQNPSDMLRLTSPKSRAAYAPEQIASMARQKADMETALDMKPSNTALGILKFLRPSELRDYRPPKGIVLVGDCHVVRGSVFVIGGAPGVGKSRAPVALTVAGATSADWLGLKIHARFRTMIVQNENGRFRLSREFADLDCPVWEDFVRVCPPPSLGLAFDRAEVQTALTTAIADFQPAVIVVDPWNAVARDEKAKDS